MHYNLTIRACASHRAEVNSRSKRRAQRSQAVSAKPVRARYPAVPAKKVKKTNPILNFLKARFSRGG